MPHSKQLFENLPLYAQLADDAGVLQIIAKIGIQPILDSIYLLLDQREARFDPYHPALRPDLQWAGQFVGLGAIGDHYLGIGLNPKWSDDVMLDVIHRAPKYWRILGTDPGIIEAISMWLRYDGPMRLYYPFGHTPTQSPPRWADYLTPYDDYALLGIEDAKILGGPFTWSSFTPQWRRYTSPYWEWEYDESYGDSILEEQSVTMFSRDPGMGPRHVWKFFYLTPETWSLIFPDIHILDIETQPALTKPVNMGWLSYSLGVDLTWEDPRLNPPTEKVRSFDIDGFHFEEDEFPFATRYEEHQETQTIVENDFEGNYSSCADYFDPFSGGIELSEETVKTSVLFVGGEYPGCQYGDIPADLAQVVQGRTATQELYFRPEIVEGEYPGATYADLYDTPFYAPSYSVFVETEGATAHKDVAETEFSIGGFSFDAILPASKLTKTTEQVTSGTWDECCAWEYIEPGLSLSDTYDQMRSLFIPSQIERTETVSEVPPTHEGGMPCFYAPPVKTEVAEVQESVGAENFIPGVEFYYPCGSSTVITTVLSSAEKWNCQPGELIDLVVGYQKITTWEPEPIDPVWIVRYNPGSEHETVTDLFSDGYSGATYEDSFTNYSLHCLTDTLIEPIPVLPSNQIFVLHEESGDVSTVVETDDAVGGLEYDTPFPLDRLPIYEVNTAEMGEVTTRSVNLEQIGEVPSITIIESLLYPLDPSNFFYFAGTQVVTSVSEGSPSSIEFEDPIQIATYETLFDQGDSYWIPPSLGSDEVFFTTTPVYEDVILAGEPFYYPCSRHEITKRVVESAEWESIKGPADYFSAYEDSSSFEFFPGQSSPVIVEQPIWETVQLCDETPSLTTFTILDWIETLVVLPLEESQARLFHPFVDTLNQEKLWHLVLDTDKGTVITTPSTIYWTQDTDFSSALKERSLSFDKEGGYVNLYLEFVLEPDTDWTIMNCTLNLNSQCLLADEYFRPLFLHRQSLMGYRFLVKGGF
jgi:hypothetical protein